MNINVFKEKELASAYFVLNHLAFSGCTLVGGYSEHSYKTGFTESNIKELEDIKRILHDVKITNLDYQKVVEAPNSDGIDNENVFVFMDPPYYSATNSGLYGKGGTSLFGYSMRNLHKKFDHLRFAEVIKKCKYKYLITYDDSPFIRKLFSFANIMPWNLTYGMRQYDNVGKELFISNYEITGKDKTNQIDIYSAWG
jgi:DNA adenine methylase